MKFFVTPVLFYFAILLLPSCKPMPNDGIPFYMKVDSISVAGSTHHIVDVSVEANASKLGTYELPCNFPVLEENEVRFVLIPGIMQTGQSTVRVPYPFYESDTFTLQAARTETYSRKPVFRYRSGTKFSFDEDFESGNSFVGFTKAESITDTNVVYGNFCGKLTVSVADSAVETIQIDTTTMPLGGDVWLEIDYKCEVPFYVGVYGNFATSARIRLPYLFVNAKNSWNKVYIKLDEAVSYLRADSYQLYFEALRPYGSGGGTVYIDNIRVLHF